MKTIKQLKSEWDAAADAFYDQIDAAIEREFPHGKRVTWKHGGHRQTGHVVRHAYGTNVWVKNERQGGGQKKVCATELEPADGK